MSQVVSLRLKDAEASRLGRLARRLRRSPGQAAALLLTEKLREEEFPFIEFRDSLVGRQAYIKGSSLAVWEVVLVARHHELDARRTAEHLEWPEEKVQAALVYAEAYPDEVLPAVEEVESFTFADLKRILPWAREVKV